MHRAAGTVTARLRQIQRFHHHALTGKCGIAMHQDRQHLRTILVTATLHARLDRTFDHRIDDFEVGWVKCQRQVHRTAGGRDIARETLVILDVASRQIIAVLAFEFFKQVLRCFAQRIDQHVQTAAMRHADHDFLHAAHTGTLDGFIHRGDKAFAAFQ